MRYERKEDWFFWKFCGTLVAAILVLLIVPPWLLTRLEAYNDYVRGVAKIEQLRADVQQVRAGANEDVIGQVTHWNQIIAANQAARKAWGWWSFVRPEWDAVQPIEIPQETK